MSEKKQSSAVIISASSDIGTILSLKFLQEGWNLFGTYRTKTDRIEDIIRAGAKLFSCDLSDPLSITSACSELHTNCPGWDTLIMCPGRMEPIGPFEETNFDEWEQSVKVNFTSQLRIVRELLPLRNKATKLGPCVLFFAGGGTNNAPVNYSAYIVSKIALIKMTELLDAEIPDTRFAIIGPGWVKTKIHDSTLKAGQKAGDNYQRTIDKLESEEECTSIEDVLGHCAWIINTPKNIVSGRNFSTVFDGWGTKELEDLLAQDPDMYKLRRHGNDRLVSDDQE